MRPRSAGSAAASGASSDGRAGGRGHLIDGLTQRWVVATGRRAELASHPWLDAPVGGTDRIGTGVFESFALERGLEMERGAGDAGLLERFDALRGPGFDPAAVHPAVVDFYERTAAYELDAWAEWSGVFRPFGELLARIFSRRLQQLNVPLSALDTSRGLTSEIVRLRDPATGRVVQTAWLRELVATGNVLYAGAYSIAEPPGADGPCVRVAFPLPNGNALVVLRPEAHDDGALSVVSGGRRFGDPGFYFTVRQAPGRVVARYVRSLTESIRVYPAGGETRADHTLWMWGRVFMRLHYRMRPRAIREPGEPR